MAVLGNLTLEIKDQICLSLRRRRGNGLLSPEVEQDLVLSAVLGTSIQNCSEFRVERKDGCIVVEFGEFGTLSIEKSEYEQGTRYDLDWEMAEKPAKKVWLGDVIHMSKSHWYGATQVRSQRWPIESWQRPMVSAFVCGDSFVDQWGGVQERYWLSSNGIAIFVDEDCPLFVSMDGGGGDAKLRLVSKFEKPYKNVRNRNLYLKYAIYQADDVKSVHRLVAGQRLAPPTCVPDERMFRHPVWSTWAQYKTKISQQLVLEYAREIDRHGFKSSQIEIDDDWTPTYGDMTFDTKKFPDPKAMVEQLKGMGHRVTLWVHPFASPWSKACFNGIKNCWVRSGVLPGVTKWWNGLGRHLDVTNPEATQWFKDSLRKLQHDYGITSFKFDAGEVNWLPPAFRFYQEVQNPNVFTKRYAELACEIDSDVRCHEVRVGWRTQHLPVFVRMMDKDSNWTWDNGLKTLIPHALTFSLLGYPFVLPDMIGGNAYKDDFPERELFIRWLQVTALMPALQFSIPPWIYDPEVVEISRQMCDLHAAFANYIVSTAKNCVVTGDPILRPLWWINPVDDIALTIDSEFLVGGRVLVAPALEWGARKRDIYFPLGRWRDQLTGELVEGPVWIRGYRVELDQLPHFVLESPGGKEGEKKQQLGRVDFDRVVKGTGAENGAAVGTCVSVEDDNEENAVRSEQNSDKSSTAQVDTTPSNAQETATRNVQIDNPSNTQDDTPSNTQDAPESVQENAWKDDPSNAHNDLPNSAKGHSMTSNAQNDDPKSAQENATSEAQKGNPSNAHHDLPSSAEGNKTPSNAQDDANKSALKTAPSNAQSDDPSNAQDNLPKSAEVGDNTPSTAQAYAPKSVQEHAPSNAHDELSNSAKGDNTPSNAQNDVPTSAQETATSNAKNGDPSNKHHKDSVSNAQEDSIGNSVDDPQPSNAQNDTHSHAQDALKSAQNDAIGTAPSDAQKETPQDI